jgi:type I restriction enzyme M protein
MALKKSELYFSLWASCDELRGGMDASQYKDYVLVLLFVKYVSDRYADEPYAPISIPKGASFADMVALKCKADIGDQINKKILGPLPQANKLSDIPTLMTRTNSAVARKWWNASPTLLPSLRTPPSGLVPSTHYATSSIQSLTV